MEQLRSDIKNRIFSRVYLIYGDEHYRITQATEALTKSVVQGDMADMNTGTFIGKAAVAADIAQAAESMPFFSDYRAVVVKGSGLFAAGRKDESEAVAKLLPSIPDTSVLIFAEESVDKRLALYKAVKKVGRCVELNKPKGAELTDWLVGKSQKRLSRALADYMVSFVGSDMSSLELELQKLISYAGSSPIKREDISFVCTRSLESSIFTLVEAIGNKKPQQALEIYNTLMLKKESPLGILAMIARQFRLILKCNYLAAAFKMGTHEIAEKLKLRDFAVNQYLNQGKNFTLGGLITAIKKCAECDINIKRGIYTDRLGVEMFIIEYSRPRR